MIKQIPFRFYFEEGVHGAHAIEENVSDEGILYNIELDSAEMKIRFPFRPLPVIKTKKGDFEYPMTNTDKDTEFIKAIVTSLREETQGESPDSNKGWVK